MNPEISVPAPKSITPAAMVSRWSGLDRPLFKGKLIDDDGCKCAQGDVLFCAGYSEQECAGCAGCAGYWPHTICLLFII